MTVKDEVSGSVYQEVDVIRLIKKIGKRSKVTQAIILQELENKSLNPDEYQELRKLILDEINNLTRSIVKDIFGDMDFLVE